MNWKEYIIQEGNAGTDVNGKFPVGQPQGELTGTDIRYKQTRLDGESVFGRDQSSCPIENDWGSLPDYNEIDTSLLTNKNHSNNTN